MSSKTAQMIQVAMEVINAKSNHTENQKTQAIENEASKQHEDMLKAIQRTYQGRRAARSLTKKNEPFPHPSNPVKGKPDMI